MAKSKREPKKKTAKPATGECFLDVLKGEPACEVSFADASDAISATWARRFNLFKIPDLLKVILDSRGQFMDKPADDDFFDAYREIGKHSDARGDLFKNPCFVDTERRTKFYRLMSTDVWSSLKAMQTALVAWHKDWIESGNAAAALVSRLGDQEVIPGALDHPSLLGVGRAARAVAVAFTKALSGFGTAVARTDAAEATRVRHLLTKPRIANAAGYETMAKLIEAHKWAVAAHDVDAEADLVSFVTGVLDAISRMEPVGLVDLLRIGKRIPWGDIDA